MLNHIIFDYFWEPSIKLASSFLTKESCTYAQPQENSDVGTSSGRQRDPPSPPNSKRQKVIYFVLFLCFTFSGSITAVAVLVASFWYGIVPSAALHICGSDKIADNITTLSFMLNVSWRTMLQFSVILSH